MLGDQIPQCLENMMRQQQQQQQQQHSQPW
jgi:hypothetical protein